MHALRPGTPIVVTGMNQEGARSSRRGWRSPWARASSQRSHACIACWSCRASLAAARVWSELSNSSSEPRTRYGAVESALERVARSVEGGLPTGRDWQVALLESMALDIEGVRPRVLSQESRPLRGSGIFRHAHAVSLETPGSKRCEPPCWHCARHSNATSTLSMSTSPERRSNPMDTGRRAVDGRDERRGCGRRR